MSLRYVTCNANIPYGAWTPNHCATLYVGPLWNSRIRMEMPRVYIGRFITQSVSNITLATEGDFAVSVGNLLSVRTFWVESEELSKFYGVYSRKAVVDRKLFYEGSLQQSNTVDFGTHTETFVVSSPPIKQYTVDSYFDGTVTLDGTEGPIVEQKTLGGRTFYKIHNWYVIGPTYIVQYQGDYRAEYQLRLLTPDGTSSYYMRAYWWQKKLKVQTESISFTNPLLSQHSVYIAILCPDQNSATIAGDQYCEIREHMDEPWYPHAAYNYDYEYRRIEYIAPLNDYQLLETDLNTQYGLWLCFFMDDPYNSVTKGTFSLTFSLGGTSISTTV